MHSAEPNVQMKRLARWPYGLLAVAAVGLALGVWIVLSDDRSPELRAYVEKGLAAERERRQTAKERPLLPHEIASQAAFGRLRDGELSLADAEELLALTERPVSAEVIGDFWKRYSSTPGQTQAKAEEMIDAFVRGAVWPALACAHQNGIRVSPEAREVIIRAMLDGIKTGKTGHVRRMAYTGLNVIGALNDPAVRETAVAKLLADTDPEVVEFAEALRNTERMTKERAKADR